MEAARDGAECGVQRRSASCEEQGYTSASCRGRVRGAGKRGQLVGLSSHVCAYEKLCLQRSAAHWHPLTRVQVKVRVEALPITFLAYR